MNCPGACLTFGAERHSYRELPLRLAEFGLVSRYEREGVLHGLLRVRAFTQDDAHVYCTLEQVPDEVNSICEAIDELYAKFGFSDVRVELSTKPEKAIGTDEQWEEADGGADRGARVAGARVPAQPRRRRLLRPEDRLPRHRCDRPLVAARHLPARLLHARALRPQLSGRGQRRAPAGDDPPRAAGLDGALRRDPDRAPRAAASRPGWRPSRRSCCRSPTATTPTRARWPSALRADGLRVEVDERSESVGQQDPRRRARQGPVHARRRRPRGRRWRRRSALARRGRSRRRRRGEVGRASCGRRLGVYTRDRCRAAPEPRRADNAPVPLPISRSCLSIPTAG